MVGGKTILKAIYGVISGGVYRSRCQNWIYGYQHQYHISLSSN
jgi:hypothetical protein